MFKRIAAFFQRRPKIKTVLLGALGAAASAATGGVFGPKAAAGSAAVTTIIGLFTKRPQDVEPEPVPASAPPTLFDLTVPVPETVDTFTVLKGLR